ncbi:MAG: glycosyltransferase [Bacteroidia bacterium]|jgi:glycosyltransferase involved in cell wall biosynthesis|nr:glycosyltransferase [Bacteroidia bacterium]
MPEARVLFLTCWYPSDKNQGSGIFVRNHAHAIKKQVQDILVVHIHVENEKTILSSNWNYSKDESDLEVLTLTISSRFHKVIYSLMPLMRLVYRRIIIKKTAWFKPTIIHSSIIAPAGIIGHSISQKLKLPHVITEHWSKIDKFMSKNLSAGYARKAYSKASALTVVSDYLKRNIERHTSNNNIFKVPNSIDTDTFSVKKESPLRDAATPIRFVAIAAWKYPKRPDLFIEALEKLALQGINVHLDMIGNGPSADLHKEKTYHFPIQWHGYLPAQSIANILRDSHYFLHASEIETFSVVVAEALCTGTPAIISARGALTEFENSDACVIAENTVDSWTVKIQEAISKPYFPKLVSETIRNKVSADVIGKRFKDIYYFCLKDSRLGD